MSPSAHIVIRSTGRGRRYQVRFRWRPSDRYARYFATFERRKDAEIARAWVLTEIAHGRFPEADRYFRGPEPRRTLRELHERFASSRRHQVGPAAHKSYRQALARYGRLAEMDPDQIAVADVQVWVAGHLDEPQALRPGTVKAYLSVLRQVLDMADLSHPNPARDKRVKVGRRMDGEPEQDPPSFAHYRAMAEAIAERHRALLVFLERTGMRITEALSITWGDVDWRDGLLRVRSGKTRAARRWVPMMADVLDVLGAVPHDDRAPARPIFGEPTANSMRSAMRTACLRAGVPVYTPHDLRHRYTSLLVMAGVPPPLVGRIVGHERVSVTIDTYAHVLLDEPTERLGELRRAAFTVPSARLSGDPAVTEAHIEAAPE